MDAPDALGWLRVGTRGSLLVALLVAGLSVKGAVRLVERPLCGIRRPVSPRVTVAVCRVALRILRLDVERRGAPAGAGVFVANHSSWLDILVLNAQKQVCFVSKAEVAGWPGIGLLARVTGTVFIERARSRAAEQGVVFRERLQAGHRLLFFPEGTSSDNRQVLPFKSTLFAAFLHDDLRSGLVVQPVTIFYEAPPGKDARFHGWWGDMALGPHLVQVLAAPRAGRVRLAYHPVQAARDYANRKAMASACETAVREGHAALRARR
jgi:1-acyl-sn-glycerol-3-phosphate acyltransferase